MAVKIQDVYLACMALHNILIAAKIHYTRDEEVFKRTWQEAVDKVKPNFPDLEIDWTLDWSEK